MFEKRSVSADNFGLSFDPDSLMNYCYVYNLQDHGGLIVSQIGFTRTDIATIRAIYKNLVPHPAESK